MSTSIQLDMILANKKTTTLYQKIKQEWCFLFKAFFKKRIHQVKMKTALKLLKTLNQKHLKENPALFFGFIKKIDPFVFEELLLLAFLFRGIKVIHNARYTGDGGIDGIIIWDGKRIAIQAKRYKNHINSAHITAFKQDIQKNGCHAGLFIHCGKSGSALYEKLSSQITLISGSNLHKLITQTYDD